MNVKFIIIKLILTISDISFAHFFSSNLNSPINRKSNSQTFHCLW